MYCYMDFPDVVSRAGVGHDVLLHGLPRCGESGWGGARCTVTWTSQTWWVGLGWGTMYCYMDFPDAVSRAGVGHNVLLHGLPRRGESGWGEARCTVTWTSQTR